MGLKPGWFAKARTKFYRKNVIEWCAYQTVLDGELRYERGVFRYRSGFGFSQYADYFKVGHERAFWLARRESMRNKRKGLGHRFYFTTRDEFEQATTY